MVGHIMPSFWLLQRVGGSLVLTGAIIWEDYIFCMFLFPIYLKTLHVIFSYNIFIDCKTHLRCISSILIHYNCKIDADIQDVYHRLNSEHASKKSEARIIIYLILLPKQRPDLKKVMLFMNNTTNLA